MSTAAKQQTQQQQAPAKCEDANPVPPDGGTRAWLVMVGAFLCNGILFGVINTYSVIYMDLHKKLEAQGETDTSSKAALVGSLAIGTTFSMSLVSGILTDRFGLRRTTLFGGILAASGMLLSSFLTDNVAALYLTYGLMYGLGAALTYTPSLAILGHYFRRYLGLVNGVVTAGSSAFTIAMPAFLNWLVGAAGLPVALRILALMSSFIILCALLFKPLQPRQRPLFKKERTGCASLVNVDNWRRKRYVIWALTIPFALFGYFVPYVHMGKFVEDAFPGRRGDLPVMCIGITSGIGRLVFGYVADLPRVDRILLQQISFASIGALTVCLPFAPSYEVLLAIALAMGLFDGCFISLLGPIAFDLCGPKGATQGIGFLLSLCSLPLTMGPPIAGLLYDHMQSYTVPLVLAGLPPLVGAIIMNFMRCVRDDSAKHDDANDAAAQPLSDPAGATGFGAIDDQKKEFINSDLSNSQV